MLMDLIGFDLDGSVAVSFLRPTFTFPTHPPAARTKSPQQRVSYENYLSDLPDLPPGLYVLMFSLNYYTS